ncbi:hypothetical protein SSPS47_09510 [Streptomyces sp. S4.7]|uniref:DUF2637 domain-containing protein n=1 Tax=Streptomyces sp. S4.7 TaxID=2705439 RepID=UPI001397B88E|nr:DUF2637 domain-containing protein [Streptomyces sp. S4.7]QHY95360.1 hypothetical protein SSPS47_09510 [Streptomyces sp. S4.7]
MTRLQLTSTQRRLIGVVIAGAVLIAAIGFVGSYAAVRELAEQKGFGTFALVFPIGIDAGIGVLLALDLLLTWVRIPFPLLHHTAWVLTAGTIAFNAAAAWPDAIGVGMHAVIPILFVVVVEAARHAVGRIADITADKHMEGVRLTRWLLSPVPTFKLWRRMKLWEIRSYEDIIQLEQDRLIYQARLQARYGRNWRRKAPIEAMMPLRLAKYGVPLADTGPAGLAAVGIEPDPLSSATAAAEPVPTAAPAPAELTAPAVEFYAAANQAVALAPPRTPPALTAELNTPAPAVHPSAPTGSAPTPVSARSRTHGALLLDLAPMDPPHPDVVCGTDPAGMKPHPQRAEPAPATALLDSDAELVERARELARTGPLSLRRMKRERGIAQRRAQRIRNALDNKAS